MLYIEHKHLSKAVSRLTTVLCSSPHNSGLLRRQSLTISMEFVNWWLCFQILVIKFVDIK